MELKKREEHSTVIWEDLHHSELSVKKLYALLKLRCEVFIVEQNCPYLDVDGLDLIGENRHILGWDKNELVACTRILKSADETRPVVIGRVIVSEALRGEKLGQRLMEQTVASCMKHWSDKAIYLGAQTRLQAFYARFGFTQVTDAYDEDGISHIGMRREAN